VPPPPPGILYRLCCSDFDQALLLLRSMEVDKECVICFMKLRGLYP
jgi:hypothetical protein